MLNGGSLPSETQIIKSSDHKVMGDLERMNLKKCFFWLLWVRLQGC